MSLRERLAIWVGWHAAPRGEARDDPQTLINTELLRPSRAGACPIRWGSVPSSWA